MKTHMKMLLFGLVALLFVGCGGGFGAERTENGFILFEGKTWIPEEGNPVELIVLNDESCGEPCSPDRGTTFFEERVTRAIIVKEVDVSSPEGEALVEEFDVLGVPSFILGNGIEELERFGAKVIDQIKPIVTESDGKYLVDSNAIGMKPGKFLRPIEFADLDSEPSTGEGPVRVVEFTDYQCPYCKRLYDQNKALIDQLIEDGTITYVVKDFPLSFHKEAPAMHSAANCAMKVGGADQYWVVQDYLFANQGEPKGLGDRGARDLYIGKAASWGLDTAAFTTCMNAQETKDEINADMAEGSRSGVSGTPALFIGNSLVPGAIPPTTFQQYVDSAKQ